MFNSRIFKSGFLLLVVLLTVNKLFFSYYQRGLFELLPLWIICILLIILVSKIKLSSKEYNSKAVFISVLLIFTCFSTYLVIKSYLFVSCKYCIATFNSEKSKDKPIVGLYDDAGQSRILYKKILDKINGDKKRRRAEKSHNLDSYTGNFQLSSLGRLSENINSIDSAKSFIKNSSNIKTILWGRKGWINVTFGDFQFIKLKKLKYPNISQEISNLRLITNISNLSFDTANIDEVANYIASILVYIDSRDNTYNNKSILLSLASVASTQWKTSQHLGYASWLLANHNLKKTFRKYPYELAYINCALKAYKNASNLVRFKDNPELSIAIAYNRALALKVQGTLLKNKNYLKQSRYWKDKVTKEIDNNKSLFSTSFLKFLKSSSKFFKFKINRKKKRGRKFKQNSAS